MRRSIQGKNTIMPPRPDYERPLFDLHAATRAPVVIESIELLRCGEIHFLRARSTDGADGLVMIYEGRHFLRAMLEERVLPFFLGRDARDLEGMIDEIYVYKWNYGGLGGSGRARSPGKSERQVDR
jgi:hypothetical protein